MSRIHTSTAAALAATLLVTAVANASTLTVVNQDGALMVSDSALNVTWADSSSGPVNYFDARTWINSLNAEAYGGYSDWKLATGVGYFTTGTYSGDPTNYGTGFGLSTDTVNNQLGYLFANELGNTPADAGAVNFGPFAAIGQQSTVYWSGNVNTTDPSREWAYDTGLVGESDTYQKGVEGYALAVRAGQVSPVPLPAAAWLLGSGLLGLFGWPRRRAS